jgi:bacterioferritin-associated ferredoxin
MYICLCKAVTDQDIHDAIDDGAHTVTQLADSCGAGTGCGRCQQMAQELIDQHLTEAQYHAA